MFRRAIRPALMLALIAVLAAPIRGAGFEIEDHETVYGLLDPSGVPTELTVVDWLRIRGRGEVTIVDPGDLADVRNVKGPERPHRVPEGLSWHIRCRDGVKDIFYSGRTNRVLPLEVKIAYVLNGKEVPAKQVGGADGDLTVNISITNRLRSTEKISYQGFKGGMLSAQEEIIIPLAVSVTMDIPAQRFLRIEAPDALTIATGATVKVTWVVFPYPTSKLSLHLTGERIRLEPIFFSAAPKMPPFPAIEVRGQLLELTQGVQELDAGLGALVDGTDQLIQGHAQMTAGVDALQAGVGDLARLNAAHQEIVSRTVAGLAEIDLDSFTAALTRLGALDEGLGQLENGLSDLIQLNGVHRQMVATIREQIETFDLDSFKKGLNKLDGTKELSKADRYLGQAAASYTSQAKVAGTARERQDDLAALLKRLAEKTPGLKDDADFKELKRLSDLQRESLHALVEGGRDNGKAYDGMTYTGRVLNTMSRQMKDGIEGAAALNDAITKASGTLEAFDRFKLALKLLAEGGTTQGIVIPGLDTAGDGLTRARDGVTTIGKGLKEAGVHQGLIGKIKDGLNLLRQAFDLLLHGGSIEGRNVPGLDTAAKGLDEVGKGLTRVGKGVESTGSGAGQIRDGLGQARSKGTQRLFKGTTDALDDLSRTEALKRVVVARISAYDHFIGKPAGAKGEVRFLLRTEGLR